MAKRKFENMLHSIGVHCRKLEIISVKEILSLMMVSQIEKMNTYEFLYLEKNKQKNLKNLVINSVHFTIVPKHDS